MKRLQELGVSHIVAVLAVAIVAVVGFTGYKVYTLQNQPKQSATVTKLDSPATASSAQPAPVELKAADTTLTQADNELQSSLDTAALDQDIDALL